MKTSPKSRKRTRASPAETKQKIVDAALAIAARKGFEQATTAEIARCARVAEGSIYNYFTTKDDLLIHMVEQYATSFREQIGNEIRDERDPVRKIERLIAFHIRFFTQEGNIFQVIFGKTPGTKVQMARIIGLAIAPYVSMVEEVIREGIEQERFRKLNPQIVASFLIGGMQLALVRRFFNLANYGAEEAVEQIRDVYLQGLIMRKHENRRRR